MTSSSASGTSDLNTQRSALSELLKTPVRKGIVILGAKNTGKSRLYSAMIGEPNRALESPGDRYCRKRWVGTPFDVLGTSRVPRPEWKPDAYIALQSTKRKVALIGGIPVYTISPYCTYPLEEILEKAHAWMILTIGEEPHPPVDVNIPILEAKTSPETENAELRSELAQLNAKLLALTLKVYAKPTTEVME